MVNPGEGVSVKGEEGMSDQEEEEGQDVKSAKENTVQTS